MNTQTNLFYQELNDFVASGRRFLETVAERFDLNFEPALFTYFPISGTEKVLLDFLDGCPGLPHSNWGGDLNIRLERVKDFIESQSFQDYCQGLGSSGSVINSDVVQKLHHALQKQRLPAWVNRLADKLDPRPEQPFHVYICLKDRHEETLLRMQKLLVHEWAHLLFFSQGILFQNLPATANLDATERWLYDEGLATWVEYAYQTGGWDCEEKLQGLLAILQAKKAPPSVTGYYEKGRWFAAYFADIATDQWGPMLKALMTAPDSVFLT